MTLIVTRPPVPRLCISPVSLTFERGTDDDSHLRDIGIAQRSHVHTNVRTSRGSCHRLIGSSRFFGYDEQRSEIEIGWTFLARSHWGGVYNGDMKRLMLRHAFQFVRSVIFRIGPQNIRSQRAVQRIGAVRDGSRVDGNGQESLVYRIGAAAIETLKR